MRQAPGLCLASCSHLGDDWGMGTTEPIYRKTCATCDRPALTLDHSGIPKCAGHAETFIASDGVSVELGETGLSVALIHRDLVIGSR